MSFSRSVLVMDLETTGLPGPTPRHLLHVVEIGFVLLAPSGKVLTEAHMLVNPGRHVLYANATRKAFEVNGLDREKILAEGTPLEHAGRVLEDWAADNVPMGSILTAYNMSFELKFVARPPLSRMRFPWRNGDCLMMLTHDLRKAEGVKGRWPKLHAAAHWLRLRGHPITDNRIAHTAVSDARTAAEIALALSSEARTNPLAQRTFGPDACSWLIGE